MASSMDPGAVLKELTQGYFKLPLTQRIVLPLLLAGSVMGIIYVAQWANRPEYTPLFSNLSTVDSAGVIQRLKEMKIKYQIEGDGSTLSISPPEMVHELRMSLSADGLPKGGTVGLEIFDNIQLGMTTTQEKNKFTRAIQGELERTINSLDGVASSRVHVTMPEKSVFAKKGESATASVMLRLRPGAELEKKQIKGISSLVAGSVAGLTLDNVTIIDVFGNLLTIREDDGDGLGVEASRLQYQREVERGYVQRIEQMLQKVMGPGKVTARVTAEMDFSQTDREEESYDAGGQVLRSERSIEEASGSTARGGVPGVVANISNDPSLLMAPGMGNDSGKRRESVRNFEVSKAISKTSSPRGKVTRLSVAVLVDGTYETVTVPTDGATAAAAPVFKALDPSVLSQIDNIVKSAVGYDSARGDTVTVENIPFFVPDNAYAEEFRKDEVWTTVQRGVQIAVPVLFVLLLFFVLNKIVKFLITPTEAEVDLSRLLPTGLQELEAELDQERVKQALPQYEPSVDMEQLEELMSENSRMVKENPQQAALLIRYWLNEGRL